VPLLSTGDRVDIVVLRGPAVLLSPFCHWLRICAVELCVEALNTALFRKTSGRNLGTLKQNDAQSLQSRFFLTSIMPFCLYLLLASFPYFEKKNVVRLMRSLCCLYVCDLNDWINLYETWYIYHGTWVHLNSILHEYLPSVCVSVCVSLLSLQGKGSVNTFPRQR
jgi:hypothetical protein